MHSYPRRPADRILTIEEFERLPEEDCRMELVRGGVVREPLPGFEHGDIGTEITSRLHAFVAERGLGRVVGHAGFVLAADPPTVRGPDVAFVAAARIPRAGGPTGFWRGAPDLAVEIRSPSNRRAQIQEKVADYLEAGCRLVWVVDPRTRTVTVHRPRAEAEIVGLDGSLDARDVVPAFHLPVAALFRSGAAP